MMGTHVVDGFMLLNASGRTVWAVVCVVHGVIYERGTLIVQHTVTVWWGARYCTHSRFSSELEASCKYTNTPLKRVYGHDDIGMV